eukprot:TRINITY_DN9187_c0_g1_i4.p1 TRINITY_DN9187_c0_g1~~TRINITY_DN9187_c0_g1_i4.p1  ORF type:complete len:260 (+),score=14.72 TRINITY_DN9187_c0_g1_i4:133-912(+)
MTSWGTRSKFRQNPKEWWNHFWLKTHEMPQFLDAKPNAGHLAIAHIVQRCNARVITQNIDRLHVRTMNVPSRLVEVHGRLGLYKCIESDCPYSYSRSIEELNLNDYAQEGTSMEQGNLQLKKVPLCPNPSCRNPIMPQSLLFDEIYASHSFYNWDLAQEWLQWCDLMIFVGTSFSVGVTAEALAVATKSGKRIYNFNLFKEDLGSDVTVSHILGRSEVTLPLLYDKMFSLAGKNRMFFYAIESQQLLPPCFTAVHPTSK